jgi:hypothetical protein
MELFDVTGRSFSGQYLLFRYMLLIVVSCCDITIPIGTDYRDTKLHFVGDSKDYPTFSRL